MKGLYGGSFDPIHRGHMAVIEAAAARVDVLWVAVLGNPDKPSGLYSIPERVALIEAAVAHLPNVQVTNDDRLLVALAERLGADVLVRGVAPRGRGRERPSPTEVHFEHQMAEANRVMSGLPTLFVPSPPETA